MSEDLIEAVVRAAQSPHRLRKSGRQRPVPKELPPTVADFTGREGELGS